MPQIFTRAMTAHAPPPSMSERSASSGRVDFDERVHAEVVLRERAQARERRVVERGDDEEQRVCARGRRLEDLVVFEYEILPQDGQPDARLNLGQVAERAAEEVLFGEHG